MEVNQKPNIFIIMADQWAHNVIGALGHPVVQTPNLDRLVENGVTFTNCYCNCPICAPSRAAFVTGKLVRNNGVFDNGSELPASTPTLMHHLRSSGYETVLSGKMHFIGPDQLHGFETRLTTDIYPSAFNWTANWQRGAYPNPGTGVKRLKNSGVCDWNVQMTYDEEVLYRTLEQIQQWGKDRDKPFFMCSSFTHPHDPFLITEHYWNLYNEQEIPMPSAPAQDLSRLHPYNQWLQIHHEVDQYPLTDTEILNARRAYYGMVSYFDHMVGRIVSELQRLKLLENTILIVTSDHGEMLGEHGMWFKRTFFDPSAKVPLLISWPKNLRSGKKVNKVVSLIDLCATIMKLADIHDYESWVSDLDGDSFHRLLEADDPQWKDQAICEYHCEGVCNSMVALRQGSYKYVYVNQNEPLLFDLNSDPNEVRDLSKDLAYAVEGARLRSTILKGLDFDQMERRVIQSQKERLMIAKSLKIGHPTAWDYQPFFDASKQYVR